MPHQSKTKKLSPHITSSHPTYILSIICILSLLAGGIIMLNPSTSVQVSAAEIIASTSTPTISLTILDDPNKVTDVAPGEIAYRTNTIRISANNYKNFSINLSSAEGYDANLHGENNPNITIASVTGEVTTPNFLDNTWGYAITEDLTPTSEWSLQYSAVPAFANGAKTIVNHSYTDNTTTWPDAKDYKLAFAAKLGEGTIADHYTTEVSLSVVGEPGEVIKDLNKISTMQEMSQSVCDRSTVGDTKRLRDTRDDKLYWVAKLRDNNCWMTQNLDFDVPETLDPATSNVKEITQLSGVQRFGTNSNFSDWQTNNTDIGYKFLAYYDPGIMLKKNPGNTNASCTYPVEQLTDQDCKDAGWMDVSTGYSAKETAPQEDEWSDTSNENRVLDGSMYDAHYLTGNYYSWSLATVNSGNELTVSNLVAASSICPKGWKLPTSDNDGSGSFDYLFGSNGYGMTKPESNNYKIYDAPLYYLAAGVIRSSSYVHHGAIEHAGSAGMFWSSTTCFNDRAYNLFFDINTVLSPSSAGTRYDGEPIRCVHDPSI